MAAAAWLAGAGAEAASEAPGATLAGDGDAVELPQAVTSSAPAIANPSHFLCIEDLLQRS
jgi:hypothetical protein